MLNDAQKARVAALEKLMASYSIVMPAEGHDHASTVTEDLAPYVYGVEPIDGAWCAVTIGHDGDTFTYLYPGYETAAGAAEKATANLRDNIYPEWPEKIVNLDTGVEIVPTVTWPSEPAEGEDGPAESNGYDDPADPEINPETGAPFD